MKLYVAAAAVLLMTNIAHAAASFRISDDNGGQIGTYLEKFKRLKDSGERVVVDGTCASACTMILGLIPRNRICVTTQAVFAFHNAWDMTASGNQVASAAGNRVLWSYYPGNIRGWISRHGGLGSRILYLQGPELAAMYPRCR